MDFEQEFRKWLGESLKLELPGEVKAFAFNLFEPASVDGVKFGVELIGAREFDVHDSDWACDEIWEPEQRQLNIPIDYSGDSWELCLRRMKKLLLKVLKNNQSLISRFHHLKGIGLGFVDGDLEIIYQSSESP